MQTLNVARMQLNAPILIIWIDQNINSQENLIYLSKLGYQPMNEYQQTHRELIPDNANSSNEVHPCFNVESSLKILTNKSYKFRETIVIVSGRLFVSFVEAFQYNIKKIIIIPKILVFTSSKEQIPLPAYIQHKEFYYYGGVYTLFKEIEDYIEKQKKFVLNKPKTGGNIKKKFEDKLIFEKSRKLEGYCFSF